MRLNHYLIITLIFITGIKYKYELNLVLPESSQASEIAFSTTVYTVYGI